MRWVRVFLVLKRRQLSGAIRRAGEQPLLKLVVLGGFAILFWIGMYQGVLAALRFVDDAVSPELARQIDGAFFPLLFFGLLTMLIASNGIIGYASLFRSRETAFLGTKPVPPTVIFLYKLAETLLFSTWAFAFIALPILLAYGRAREAHAAFYLVTPLLFAPFALIPAALGSAVSLAIVRWMPRWLPRLLGVGLVAALMIGWATARKPARAGSGVFSEAGLSDLFGRLAFTDHPLLPSRWLSRAALGAARGEPLAHYAIDGLALLASGAFAVYLVACLAYAQLPAAWDRHRASGGKRRQRRPDRVRPIIELLLGFLPQRLRMFIAKDVLTFLRDPVQWSQALLLLGLLAFYILNLRTFRYEQRPAFYRSLVAFLNLTATSLVMATFAARFVFPLLSLEGKRFWVLGVAPIPRRELLLGKFIFSALALLLAGESLTLISCWMLRLEPTLTLVHAAAMIGICCGLSGLAVGLGAAFPNFAEDDPSKIVAGFGGTLNLVLSLLFIGVVVGALGVPTHLHVTSGGKLIGFGWVLTGGAVALVTCLLASWLPLRLGGAAFERLEA